MDAKTLGKLRTAIEAGWGEQVTWLQKLVRFPSLRGHEAGCQDWLCSQFAARGWNVDRYTLADIDLSNLPGNAPLVGINPALSPQVIATIAPSGRAASAKPGRSLILQGHVDVVPSGPEDMWADPPFSGTVRDGWLLGRGAQDMKMGISALVFALDAIRATDIELAGPVYLQTVTEEESTGNGALSTLARGCRADACLIPEPTANTLTRAQTGAIWFKLRVRGNAVHVARAQDGANAILASFTLIKALQELTASLNVEAKQHSRFGRIANPIKFNVGIIRGGDWASSTPSWCETDCRIGVLPGRRVEEVQQSILDCVHDAARRSDYGADPPLVEWNGFQAEGAVLEPGSAAEATLAAAHQSVFQAPMAERLSTAVNDTRYYALYRGIPALCYGPSGKGMHGTNERADLANLKETTLVIAAFVADWCGIRKD